MTTIALSGGVMAADSYASDDSTVMQVHKCVRLPNGDVAGGAGDCGEVAQALAWLARGKRGAPPEIPGASILYTVNGVGHMACTKWPGIRIKGDAAIGSGAQGALVALRMGLSAEEAVKAVAGIDPHTGGEIEVLPVGKPKRKQRA
jgi:hypothetical protein